MLFVELIIGFIFIICGVLVKKFPNLIAGYNSMSTEEKQGIDIKKFSTFLHNGLVTIGSLLILTSILFLFIEIKPLYKLLVWALIIILGMLYTLLNAAKK